MTGICPWSYKTKHEPCEALSRYANEPDFAAKRGYEVIRGLLDEN